MVPPGPLAPAAPATDVAPPSPGARVAAQAPTREAVLAQIAQLRAARAAVRAHQLESAAGIFDELLHVTPRAPRILCEAGYVSHLAGRDAQAASRIDLALDLFGPDADLPASLRAPVAMCLFNRGLVAEARHDVAVAAASWQRSLALRPNRAVSEHLARLATESGGSGEEDGAIGGVAARAGERSVLVLATDEARLLEALGSGLAGEDWDGEPTTASTTVLATVPLAGGPYSRALVVGVDDGSAMLGNTSFVIALEEPSGYRVVSVAVGSYDATDHGHSGGCDAQDLHADVAEGLLRLAYDVACGETSMDEVEDPEERDGVSCYATDDDGETTSSHVILCALDTEPDCVHFVTARQSTRPPSHTVDCIDEDGTAMPVPLDAEPVVTARTEDALAFALDVLAERRVRITRRTSPGTPPDGEHAWSELHAWSVEQEPVGAPSFLFDEERAAAEGGEEGEEGPTR